MKIYLCLNGSKSTRFFWQCGILNSFVVLLLAKVGDNFDKKPIVDMRYLTLSS